MALVIFQVRGQMLQAEQNKKVLVGWGKVLQVIDQVDIINHKNLSFAE